MLENDNFLHNLYVAPAYQGQGVGSALLEKVPSRFRSTGALKCLLTNKAAQGFYLQRGWKIIAQGESEQGKKYVLMHFVLALSLDASADRR
nr:Fe-S-binding ATPase [Candidatus Pantoea persica]